jgi:hypothetical protein
VFVKGANTIDVGPNLTKAYTFQFRSVKETNCLLTITFENPETKEYVFYEINMNVTTADPNPVTELVGVVRDVISANLSINNPLKQAVTILSTQIINEYPDYLIIKPLGFTIPPESVNFI